MTQHFQVATIILKLALIDPPIRGLLRLMRAIYLISPTLKPRFLAATKSSPPKVSPAIIFSGIASLL